VATRELFSKRPHPPNVGLGRLRGTAQRRLVAITVRLDFAGRGLVESLKETEVQVTAGVEAEILTGNDHLCACDSGGRLVCIHQTPSGQQRNRPRFARHADIDAVNTAFNRRTQPGDAARVEGDGDGGGYSRGWSWPCSGFFVCEFLSFIEHYYHSNRNFR
jgi:hypothetical protein